MCRIWLSCIVRDGTGVMRGGVARITDDREGIGMEGMNR